MKVLIPCVGHIRKTFIDERDARKMVKKGSGVMVRGVLHCLRSGIRHNRESRPVQERGYYGPTQGEYRARMSAEPGDGGPIVMQLEQTHAS